jgi:hypothetical protein
MSLNNELNAKRDSFDDRICDDMCEVLLSGLSLEDKIRLECVSKQIQRCVYRRQYSVNTNDLFLGPEVYRESDDSYHREYNELNEQNFGNLLKKCAKH